MLKSHQYCDSKTCGKYGLVGVALAVVEHGAKRHLPTGGRHGRQRAQSDHPGLRAGIVLYGVHAKRDLHLERVQIDEFWSLVPYLPITDSDPFFGHQFFQGKWPAGM